MGLWGNREISRRAGYKIGRSGPIQIKLYRAETNKYLVMAWKKISETLRQTLARDKKIDALPSTNWPGSFADITILDFLPDPEKYGSD